MRQEIFVYVQAIPISIPSSAKGFRDLAGSQFRISHSSKLVLSRASGISSWVVAMGHSSVLREALARGATRVIPLPLYDDPVKQTENMKNFIGDSALVLIGENLDGPFSGAALAGVLSSLCNLRLLIDSDLKSDLKGSIILLRDPGTEAFNIDVRKIPEASKEIPVTSVVGNCTLERRSNQIREKPREETPEDVASNVSRKLRRILN
jgi:hypothetical protein